MIFLLGFWNKGMWVPFMKPTMFSNLVIFIKFLMIECKYVLAMKKDHGKVHKLALKKREIHR